MIPCPQVRMVGITSISTIELFCKLPKWSCVERDLLWEITVSLAVAGNDMRARIFA